MAWSCANNWRRYFECNARTYIPSDSEAKERKLTSKTRWNTMHHIYFMAAKWYRPDNEGESELRLTGPGIRGVRKRNKYWKKRKRIRVTSGKTNNQKMSQNQIQGRKYAQKWSLPWERSVLLNYRFSSLLQLLTLHQSVLVLFATSKHHLLIGEKEN